jgi:integrase
MGDIVRKVGKNGQLLGWYIRYVDVDGKRKQRASGQESKAGARKVLVQIEARVAQGLLGMSATVEEPGKPPEDFTVAQLFERFLQEFSSPKIKDLRRYRYAAEKGAQRLLELIGEHPVATLTKRQLEQARDQLAIRFKPNSIRSLFRPLCAAFSWALKEGLLTTNLVKNLELPRAEQSLEHLSREEAAALLEAADGLVRFANTDLQKLLWRSRRAALHLALRLGLRRGEIWGLRWQDLDLDAGRCTVARSYRAKPKSGKARHLPLPTELVEVLRDWKRDCPVTEEGLVCPQLFASTWKMMGPSRDGGLRQMVRAAGLRRFTRGWHVLRHSFASLYISSGGSLAALQIFLGHASPTTTQIYAHLSPSFLAEEMQRVKI